MKLKLYSLFTIGILSFALIHCTNVNKMNHHKNALLLKNDTIPKVKQTEIKDTVVYSIVEQMPEFPGGDIGLKKFVAENIDFSGMGSVEPWGKAYVRFMVSTTGKVDSITIMNKIPLIVEERISKVIKKLPAWKPGMQRGHLVNVWCTITINEPL